MDRFAKDAYATYDGLPDFPYNCVKYLMINNERLWKVLKHDTLDALSKPNLTLDEKRALIYDPRVGDTTKFHVFLDTGQDDAEHEARAVLRVSPYTIDADNRTLGNVKMLFELYCHYKYNMLDGNICRLDVMTNEILRTLNGQDIEGVGRLVLSRMNSLNNGVRTYGAVPWKGYWILMSTFI